MYKILCLALTISIFGSQPVFAYIDPGSGSAIMSVLIGFFVALGVVVKTFWYKIMNLLGLSKSTNTTSSRNNEQLDQNKK
jgi:hypothetical protein